MKKDILHRVALTVPETLLGRLDERLATERTQNHKLDRSQLIRHCIKFYLDNREAVHAERMAFAAGVEARINTKIREDLLVTMALLRLQAQQQNIPESAVDEAFRWAQQNVDRVQKLIPAPLAKRGTTPPKQQ